MYFLLTLARSEMSVHRHKPAHQAIAVIRPDRTTPNTPSLRRTTKITLNRSPVNRLATEHVVYCQALPRPRMTVSGRIDTFPTSILVRDSRTRLEYALRPNTSREIHDACGKSTTRPTMDPAPTSASEVTESAPLS